MIESFRKDLEGQTVLVTGGAGFIGSHLIEHLQDFMRVRVLDNFSRDAFARSDSIRQDEIEIFKGDVCDRALVERAAEGAHHIIHLASIAGVDTVLKKPVETMRTALEGTMAVLDAGLKNQKTLKRLIDFSTSEVFGVYAYKVSEGNITSLGAVGEARWTYAVSKLATEHLAHNFHRQFGLPTCSVRPFNIFGPNQVGEGAIHQFVVRALKGEDLIVHNEGDQIRSWCHVRDIVDGILRCMSVKEAVGEAFNIGNPRNTLTIYQLAKEIKRLSGSDSSIQFKTWQQQDVELRIPDIQKAKTLLGFKPKVDLEAGLEETIDWYRCSMA